MTDSPAVLWEDAHGLAVDKPAGMLIQDPGGAHQAGEVTLEDLVRRYLRPEDPASVYLGTVHRLDRPVSGVVLWAKTHRAARRWADQFANRQARKEYGAIVEGNLGPVGSSGVWDDHLAPPDVSGVALVVAPGLQKALRAITRFAVVATSGNCTRLTLRPETGRTHQLRAQAAARGAPIVGDSTYGSSRSFSPGIALHARSLIVHHPSSRLPLAIEAPWPASWTAWPGWSEFDREL